MSVCKWTHPSITVYCLINESNKMLYINKFHAIFPNNAQEEK